jgi:hypothetical protein
MSDTPRTDKRVVRLPTFHDDGQETGGTVEMVPAAFARELEREVEEWKRKFYGEAVGKTEHCKHGVHYTVHCEACCSMKEKHEGDVERALEIVVERMEATKRPE